MPVLTREQIAFFHREGFLVAKDVIPRGVIEAVAAEIDSLVDASADALHADGKIADKHSELGYLHRAEALYAQCPEINGMVSGGVGFPKPSERRPTAGKAFFNLLTCDAILTIMEQLFDSSEVFVSGVYRLRCKLPGRDNGVVPWHQDQCFFAPISDAKPSPTDWSDMPPVITTWVPLMDATVETGAMQVLAPAQRGLHKHYNANVTAPGTTIHPDHFPEGARVVDVPAMIGDALIFSAYAPHRSTENTAGVVRWAADLRYNVPEAGNYYPGEGGFLGRSSREPAVTDWRKHTRNPRRNFPGG